MIYLIFLLIIALFAQGLLLRKGLKAARKESAQLRRGNPSTGSGAHLQSNTRMRQPVAPTDAKAFVPSDISEKEEHASDGEAEFPDRQQKRSGFSEFAEMQRDLRAKEQSGAEQSMLDIIQEIRRGTSKPKSHSDKLPSVAQEKGDLEHNTSPAEEEAAAQEDHADDEILELNEEAADTRLEEDVVKIEDIEEAEEVPSPEELIKNGVQLVRQKKLDEGIDLLEQAIEFAPQKAEAHFNLGIAYMLKDFPEKAIQAYQTAIEIDPEYGKALFNLGTLHLKQGEHEKAIMFLEQSIPYLQDPIKALWNLYEAYRSAEDAQNVLVTLQKLIDREPDDASLYNHLGICYVKLGDYPKAINSWKNSIALGASSQLIYYNLGKTYELYGDIYHAIEQYTKFLTLTSDSSNWNNLVPEVQARLEHLQQDIPQ